MRKLIFGVVIAMGGLGGAVPADAMGESCKRPIAAEGGWKRGESAARQSAIGAWQQKARATHGRAFADWYYSGDRTFACRWKGEGRNAVYQCVARALPCGPR